MSPNTLYLSSSLRQLEAAHADEPLMQRAGAAAASWATTLADQRIHPVLVLAGPGNNGGDAFEVARLLRERFFDVHLVFIGRPDRLPFDAAAARQRFVDAGGSVLENIPESFRWSLIVDGLFGIGLARAPDDTYAQWISTANHLARRDHCPLLALDCPSGLNADTGTRFSPCIQASHTITFIAGKPGLLTADGPDFCGEIRVADLALTPTAELEPDGHVVTVADFSAHLKARRNNTHKGSFGSAGILGGSKTMVGAAFLTGRAALKLGAGRVYLGLLDTDAPTVDLIQPELMMRPANTLLGADLQALACGPGLGRSSEAASFLEQSLKAPLNLVLDADALNLLAEDRHLEGILIKRVAPTILTPHPAEAARLLGCSVGDVQLDRIKATHELATRYRSHVALKGCGTVIAFPHGDLVNRKFWLNSTGNPGMATAGMGDVLSGLIVALLAQNWPPEMALLAGVHLHGAAADQLVAKGIGPIGLTAGEVIDAARNLFNEWIAGNNSL
jgi:ADP-dependent NAD(P)H-hydrate dehydratase / NAD(P)H-hydrate epimerase